MIAITPPEIFSWWRTHRGRGTPGRRCLPTCPARALRDANSYRSPLHPTDAGCADRSGCQHCLADHCTVGWCHH